MEGKKQYQVKIQNRFSALGTWDENADINRAWEGIRKNIKTSAAERVLGYHELKWHKLCFDEEYSKL
jgi:hypothetical protein